MRRWIAFIALMLLLGAASTWAIAWFAAGIGEISVAGVVLAKGADERSAGASTSLATGWERSVRSETATASAWWLSPEEHRDPRKYRRMEFQPAVQWSAASEICTGEWDVSEGMFGWPLRAMRAAHRSPRAPWSPERFVLWQETFQIDRGLIAGSVDVRLFGRSRRKLPPPMLALGPLRVQRGPWEVTLPVRPIATAFIADMVVLGGMWATAILSLRAMRRATQLLRRRRQRCSWCGHRQSAADVRCCAECGRDPRSLDAFVTCRTLGWVSAVLLLLVFSTIATGAALRAMVETPTEIESAALRGDTERVQSLIQNGASIASANPCVTPLLAWAAASGDTSTIQVIIDAGAPLDSGVDCAATAVEIAIVHGRRAAIDMLIDAGALDDRIASSTPSNITAMQRAFDALTLAAAVGDGATSESILHRRPSMLADFLRVNRLDGNWSRTGWSLHDRSNLLGLLRDAASAGNASALVVLLERLRDAAESIDDIDASAQMSALLDGSDALRAALRWRRIEQVHLLLKLGAPLENETYGTAFVGAIESGDPEMVKFVFEAGGGPILMKHDPIVWALRAQSSEIVRLLIANGASVNAHSADGMTPLAFAMAERFPVEWLRLLVDLGADPALACNGLPIAQCIDWEGGDDQSIEFLHSVAAFFAGEEDRGGRLLVHAINAGEVRAVERLLREGADPHERVDYGGSAANVAKEIVSGEWVPSNTADHESARRAAQLVLDRR